MLFIHKVYLKIICSIFIIFVFFRFWPGFAWGFVARMWVIMYYNALVVKCFRVSPLVSLYFGAYCIFPLFQSNCRRVFVVQS